MDRVALVAVQGMDKWRLRVFICTKAESEGLLCYSLDQSIYPFVCQIPPAQHLYSCGPLIQQVLVRFLDRNVLCG